jgi:hypothetical protein
VPFAAGQLPSNERLVAVGWQSAPTPVPRPIAEQAGGDDVVFDVLASIAFRDQMFGRASEVACLSRRHFEPTAEVH